MLIDQNEKFIWSKALFISIGLHILIFTMFNIQFTIHPESFKPRFNFLGSILSKNDVTIYNNPKKYRAPNVGESTIKNLSFTEHPDQTLNSFQSEKPRQQKNFSAEKYYIKSNLMKAIDTQTTLDDTDPFDELKIEINPYNPLTLPVK